jgi:hypothetical protein
MKRTLALGFLLLWACSPTSSSDGGTGGGTAGGAGGGAANGTGGGAAGGGGTDPKGTGSLIGTLAFTVRAARTIVSTAQDGGVDLTFRQQGLVDTATAMLCTGTPIGTDVRVTTVKVGRGDDGGLLVPGTYNIGGDPPGPSGGAQVYVGVWLADGGWQQVGESTGGTVTYSHVDVQRMAGAFDVTLKLGDAGTSGLSGTFDAPACL